MKYLVIDSCIRYGAVETVEEFNDRDEALKYAREMWLSKCESDKKRCDAFYVLESVNPNEDADNHYDGDLIKSYK